MKKYESWFGVGVKTGGTLFVVGAEGVSGNVWNLGDMSESHSFQMLSARIGLGLGAGTGLVGVFIFNCLSLWALHNKTNTDWGVNLSVGGKWLECAKLLGKARYAQTIAKFKQIAKLTPDEAENIRNAASALYTNYDIHSTKGPKMVMIDIPMAGVGLELSAHYLQGTMEFGD